MEKGNVKSGTLMRLLSHVLYFVATYKVNEITGAEEKDGQLNP
jgi:hypothetical protein